jgi:transposase
MIMFWSQPNTDKGVYSFNKCYRTDLQTSLPKVMVVARTLKAHQSPLLTNFQYPITNALTEGFNSKLKAIQSEAGGFPALRYLYLPIPFLLRQTQP